MRSMQRTNWAAPPSSRSSRSTEVTTTCLSPMAATLSARFSGSRASTAPGLPVLTLQKAQARVQISPRIITVTWPRDQHSPMLGHAASSHTVTRPWARMSLRVSPYPADVGALTRIHGGLRGCGVSAFRGCTVAMG